MKTHGPVVQTAVLTFILDRNGYLRDEGGQHDVQWKKQDSKYPAFDSGTWSSETWLMGAHRSGVPWKSGWRAGVLAAVELCLIRYTFLEVCHVSQLKTLK